MASRNTHQRRVVEEQLRALDCHPTADRVYEAVRSVCPGVGKATVYRSLNRMVEEGSAQRVRVNNGPDCFDCRTHPHYHIRCTRCGRVDDVDVPFDSGLEEAASATGYIVTGHVLQFDGVCPACAAEDEGRLPAL